MGFNYLCVSGFIIIVVMLILMTSYYIAYSTTEFNEVVLRNKILRPAFEHFSMGETVSSMLGKNPKKVLFFNPANFQLVRNIPDISLFQNCMENNCVMTYNRSEINVSDAVILHSCDFHKPLIKKRQGHIWIMIQHESTQSHSQTPWYAKNKINWTMT